MGATSGTVSNPEFLASCLQRTFRSTKTVIAIMPKIGAVGTSATSSSSPTPLASHEAAQPFSAVLEQVEPSLGELLGTQADTNHGPVQGNCSSVSGSPKHEAKSSDSKTNDPQSGGKGSIQTPASSPDAQVPLVVAQPVPAPVIPWNAGSKDFTTDAGTVLNDKVTPSSAAGADSSASPDAIGRSTLPPASPSTTGEDATAKPDAMVGSTLLPKFSEDTIPAAGADSTAKPDATGRSTLLPASPSTPGEDATAKPDAMVGSTLLPKFSEDTIPAEPQSGPTPLDSATPTGANSSEAAAVASLMSDIFATAPDSKTQPVSVPLPHNLSHGTADTADAVNKAQAAAKAETEQVIGPPSVVPLAIVSAAFAPAKVSVQGTQSKPVLEKSRVGVTQESFGTTRKDVEVTGTAKAQPRKDDSSSSAGSQAANQGASDAPPKTTEPSPSFSLTGVQVSPATVDAKNASVSVSPDAGDRQTGQLDQKSTGVAETQSHADAAPAYPTSLVHSAKLIERIGEAELRLGIRAGEFGSVDIRTSMVRNQFTAEISVERGELSRVLAAELPSLQNRLTEQHVPVANITVQNHAGSHSSASEQQKPRDGRQQYATNPSSERTEGPMPALAALEGTMPASRLDIHM